MTILALVLAPLCGFADTSEVRLRVVFYPAVIIPPTDGKTPPRFTATQVQDNILKVVSDQIASTHPLYVTCYYDLTNPTPQCDPTTAKLLITIQFTPDPKSSDSAHPDWSVTMRSLDMINGRIIKTLSLGPLTESNLTATGSTVDTALKAIAPKPDDVTALIGTAAIINNRLSLLQGYEPYLQLVPTLSDANQPTYLPLIANLLDRRGLPSVPSQFNAGVVASGSTPLDTICGRGQRYLVYALSSEQYTHQVSFSTRIQTHANAELFDCTTMSVIPVGLDQHVNVLTTKGPLTSLLSIIQAAFFWQSKDVSPVPLNVIGLVSPFVDAVPDSDPVKHSVADRALQGLVDQLCDKLEQIAATQASVPPQAPLPVRVLDAKARAARILLLKQRMQRTKHDLNMTRSKLRAAKTEAEAKPLLKQLEKQARAYSASVTELTNFVAPPDTPAQTPLSNPGPAQPAAAGTTLVSLDVSGFVAASPPPLRCSAGKIDKWSGSSADPTRWKQP